MSIIKWTDIESLHHLRKGFNAVASRVEGYKHPVVQYRAKVKLHGTNAGVQILPDGEVLAQGRNRILKPGDGNFGFYEWVESKKDYFRSLGNRQPIGQHMIIYGEWCGKGVQRGAAISQVGRKLFAVFAVQQMRGEDEPLMTGDPNVIGEYLDCGDHDDLFVLPWHWGKYPVEVDYGNRDDLQVKADLISDAVNAVEKNDPWVSQMFGVDGVGEGLVLYPDHTGWVPQGHITNLMFKAKGEKHKVVKQKRPVQIDPEKAASAREFVDMVLPEPRLEQGLQEACGRTADMKMTGQFLKWIGQDVKKECQDELAASSLEWKDVSKLLANRARDWFKAKAEAI